MSKELSKPKEQLATLRTMLEGAAPKLQEVASEYLKVDRMVRLLIAAAGKNPKIAECSPTSIMQFAMKCSETGLEPIGPGGAWPIPYENRKLNTVELTFVPDYRGLVHAAKRAGCITDSFPVAVYEKDHFEYEMGLYPKMEHKPATGDRGEFVAAYCVLVLPGGDRRFEVMSKGEIDDIRAKSKGGNFGPWNTDYSEMAKKTVIRRALKQFSGATPELGVAIQADNEAETLNFIPEPIALPIAREPQAIEAPKEPLKDQLLYDFRSLLGDKEPDAVAWMIAQKWIPEGEGIESLDRDEMTKLVANPKSTLNLFKKKDTE